MLPCQRAVPTTPADRNGCICPVSFPVSCCLPGYTGRSASASLLSRPAQASLTLRPTGSLSRPRRPLSQGSSPFGYPNKLPVSYSINRLLSRWNLPPLATRAQRGTLRKIATSNFRMGHDRPRRFCPPYRSDDSISSKLALSISLCSRFREEGDARLGRSLRDNCNRSDQDTDLGGRWIRR